MIRCLYRETERLNIPSYHHMNITELLILDSGQTSYTSYRR